MLPSFDPSESKGIHSNTHHEHFPNAGDDVIVVCVRYVYLLRCSDGSLYVGRTTDLSQREQKHNDGHGAAYTAARRPVRIVYAEEHTSELSAARRERRIKGWTSAKKEALIAGQAKPRTIVKNSRPAFTWRDWLKS